MENKKHALFPSPASTERRLIIQHSVYFKVMRLLLATTNLAKQKRICHLLEGTNTRCLFPQDYVSKPIDVVEGSDLEENAKHKALAYRTLTRETILGTDSAFVIPDESLDPAMVKRNALQGRDALAMTQQEIAEAIVSFYRTLVQRRGVQIDAYWKDVFVLSLPDGSIKIDSSERPVALTAEVHGTLNPFFPLRSMHIVKATGKYTSDQTPEEEQLELKPIKDALHRLLGL